MARGGVAAVGALSPRPLWKTEIGRERRRRRRVKAWRPSGRFTGTGTGTGTGYGNILIGISCGGRRAQPLGRERCRGRRAKASAAVEALPLGGVGGRGARPPTAIRD